LPGPWFVRGLILAALAVALVAACFMWFFPWLAPLMPFNDVTMDDSPAPSPTVTITQTVAPQPGQ
jgi:cell division septal protein FtsQ